MADDVRNAIVETLMQRAAMEGGGMGAGEPAAAAMAPEATQPPPVSAPADPALPTTTPPGSAPDPTQTMMAQRAAMRQALAGRPRWGGMFGGMRADAANSGTPSYSMAGQGTGGMFGAGGGMAPPPQGSNFMGSKGMASAPGQPTGPSGFGGKATPGAAPSMMGA